MDTKHAVGSKIRMLRKRRMLTQPDLAEVIDRSVDALSNLERGISLPNFETLERLSAALGVPVRDFFPGSPEEERDPKRAGLFAKLNDLARSLANAELELAVEQIEVLAKRRDRSPLKGRKSPSMRKIDLG